LALALAAATGSAATAADAGKGLARWGMTMTELSVSGVPPFWPTTKQQHDTYSSADGSADLGFLKVLYGHDAAGFYLFKNGRLHEIRLVLTDPTEIPTILNRVAEQYGAPSINSWKRDGRCVEDSRAWANDGDGNRLALSAVHCAGEPTVLMLSYSEMSNLTGQAAVEHHVWQDSRSFEPMSHTAEAITGPIKLSGNPHFATPGSKMTITFGKGKSVVLTALGASWREWNDADHGKVTGEIFPLDHDPGSLEQGNTLCGGPTKNPARFIVFHEDSFLATPLLGVAVFGSKDPPWDINSPGLCGTFSFYVK